MSSSRRLLKAAQAIRQVVSMAILAELKDPRVRGVTVTHVEVAPDMRSAKVHVSVMGDETAERLCLSGLRSSAGYLQSRIAEGIDTRYTPRLEFVLDQGVKKSIAIATILNRVLTPAQQDTDAAAEDAAEVSKDASADPPDGTNTPSDEANPPAEEEPAPQVPGS
ncbi:MAG: 30S ribosome-binding factor RbfA [Pirellulales bacterium]